MLDRHVKISGSITAIGLVTALVAGVLYFMALPIFDEIDLAWTFVVGLVSAAISALSFIVRAIWE